jgi:cell wall-associated NlpC family hydrolase
MRGAVAALCVVSVLVPGHAAGARVSSGWAKSAIELVTSRGIFPGTPATFRPADPLTGADLSAMLTALGDPADTMFGAQVTISGLDAALVNALGLRPVAIQFAEVARSAGLDPPSRFGTEVVARLLGLRTDLPVADDAQEPQPQQPATRAEAAFSAARVLALAGAPPSGHAALGAAEAGSGVRYVSEIASGFAIPSLSPLQEKILATAVSLIGFPYVWGGTNEKVEPGFDCSGYVWRVFKLAAYAGAPGLRSTLHGRTAAQMAVEVPRARRIDVTELQPADVLFFRPTPHGRASTIDHMGIYLGTAG